MRIRQKELRQRRKCKEEKQKAARREARMRARRV